MEEQNIKTVLKSFTDQSNIFHDLEIIQNDSFTDKLVVAYMSNSIRFLNSKNIDYLYSI